MCSPHTPGWSRGRGAACELLPLKGVESCLGWWGGCLPDSCPSLSSFIASPSVIPADRLRTGHPCGQSAGPAPPCTPARGRGPLNPPPLSPAAPLKARLASSRAPGHHRGCGPRWVIGREREGRGRRTFCRRRSEAGPRLLGGGFPEGRDEGCHCGVTDVRGERDSRPHTRAVSLRRINLAVSPAR